MADDRADEVAELRRQLAEAGARNDQLTAELAREREHARLVTQVLSHAPEFLAQITPDGRFMFVNRFFPAISVEEMRRMSIYDFTEPEHHDAMRSAIARAVATRTQQTYETTSRAQPQPMHYLSHVAPRIENGEVTSLVLVATDVGRLKDAEAALAESQMMLLHVLSATGMGMWWWDRDRAVAGHDAATARIFGWTSCPGDRFEPVLERVHPDDRARVQASIDGAFASGVYGPLEHRVVHPDGTTRWVTANGRLLVVGGSTRLVVGVLDITERKRLEEQLAHAQKMESIGQLAGGIAHDFNNMLTAILSYTQFALAAVPAGSRVAKDLGEVRRAAERSVALTSQLLAFARKQRIEPTIADLNEVVRQVEDLLQRALGESIELDLQLHAAHPVHIDVNQFEQVLLNLTANARDAMPRGGRLTIETASAEIGPGHAELSAGAYVVLRVSDTGEGIAPQHLPRVFEPFFTTKDQGKGTGLGLATCYGIVSQNNGHITVHSEVGEGTTFAVYLPRAGGAVQRATPVPAAARAAAAVKGTETVLVVEDEPHVRAVTIATLEQAGYRVLAASNGREALALAHAHAGVIDLLVADVVMPQLGGFALVEQLTAVRPELAVLFVTGYTDAALDGRAIDLLPKPFAPSTLTMRVRQALDRRERHWR